MGKAAVLRRANGLQDGTGPAAHRGRPSRRVPVPGYKLTADPPAERPPTGAGLLAMAGFTVDHATVHGSRFFITTTAEARLGPRNVIFGRCAPQSVMDAIVRVCERSFVRSKPPRSGRWMCGARVRSPRSLASVGVAPHARDMDTGSSGSDVGEAFGHGSLGSSNASTSVGSSGAAAGVRFGELTVKGALSPEEIRKVVRKVDLGPDADVLRPRAHPRPGPGWYADAPDRHHHHRNGQAGRSGRAARWTTRTWWAA